MDKQGHFDFASLKFYPINTYLKSTRPIMSINDETAFIHYEIRDHIAWMTLDRPPANVMNIEMLTQMERAITELASNERLLALVLRAEGKLFSAGVDIADHTVEKVDEMIPLFHRVCLGLAEFPVPTISVVHGHALGGGCELVICCDFAVMADGARIGQPEILLASLAPIAAVRLPSLVGLRQAARILFTGEQIDASTASQIGLVNQAVLANELNAATDGYLKVFEKMSATALRHTKNALLLSEGDWREKIPAIERFYLEELMASNDAVEGLNAFLEKRDPVWKHC
jgi:cyclohexa-1,5-dienecarbonyl-CoA hydratase